MLQGLTAHYLSHSTFPIKPGHKVLVHAAAGGVGLLARSDGEGAGCDGLRHRLDPGKGRAGQSRRAPTT